MKKIITYLITVGFILSISIFPVQAANQKRGQVKTITQKTISLNTMVTDKIVEYKDKILYKVNVPQKGYINVDFFHEYIDCYGLRSGFWTVTVYNAQMEKMSVDDIKAYEMTTKLTKIGVDQGVYYIQVNENDGDGLEIPYQLRVNHTASDFWETEFNDTRNSADNIFLNKSIYGTAMDYGDDDYFKIKMPYSGYMNVTVTQDSYKPYTGLGSDYWYVTIYNSQMKELNGATIFTNEIKKKIGSTKVSAGTYYIKMDSQNPTYPYKVIYGLKATYQFYNRNPKITSLKKGKKKADIKWWKVAGVQKYEVYMSKKKGSGYKRIKTTNALKYTKKKLKSKRYYYFKVRAYKYVNGEKTYTPFSGVKKVKIK